MNVLIIGLGSIGQRHLRNIYKLFPDTNFFAYKRKNITPSLNEKNKVINLDLIKKYKIKKIYNLKNLNKLKLHAAFICSPSNFHVKEAIILLKNNINTFVEKPLGSNSKKLNILEKVIKKTNANHMMGFQMRFNPIFLYLKKLLKKNSYGKLNFVSIHNGENIQDFHGYEDYRISYAARKSLGGGAILSQIHEIDYFMNLFSDYKIIKSHSILSKNSQLDLNVEDTVTCIFQLQKKSNKFTANLNLNFYERPKKRTITMIFDKMKIIADFNKNTLEFFLKDKIKKKIFSFKRNDIFMKEIKFFFKHIKSKKKIKDDLNIVNGLKILKFCLDMKKI